MQGHIETKIKTILNGEVDVTLIALGKKSEFEITSYIEGIKKEQRSKLDEQKEQYIDMYTNLNDDEKLYEHFLIMKSRIKMSELGKSATDEEVQKDIKKYKDKYLADKTKTEIIDELALMNANMVNMKRLIDATCLKTLECVTRKPEDLTKRYFKDISEIEEQLDETELYLVWETYNKSNKLEEAEIKN